MILQVTVKPNARQQRLKPLPDGTWRAYVMSPPHEGRANAERIALPAGSISTVPSQRSPSSTAQQDATSAFTWMFAEMRPKPAGEEVGKPVRHSASSSVSFRSSARMATRSPVPPVQVMQGPVRSGSARPRMAQRHSSALYVALPPRRTR
jgi:hypothetical protein